MIGVKSQGVRGRRGLGLGERECERRQRKRAGMRAGAGATGPRVLHGQKTPHCFLIRLPCSASGRLCDHGWAPPLSGP